MRLLKEKGKGSFHSLGAAEVSEPARPSATTNVVLHMLVVPRRRRSS